MLAQLVVLYTRFYKTMGRTIPIVVFAFGLRKWDHQRQKCRLLLGRTGMLSAQLSESDKLLGIISSEGIISAQEKGKPHVDRLAIKRN